MSKKTVSNVNAVLFYLGVTFFLLGSLPTWLFVNVEAYFSSVNPIMCISVHSNPGQN